MRPIVFFIIFMTSIPFLKAQTVTLDQEIDSLVEHSLPHSTVGIWIKDIQSNQVMYARNADKLLNPASNIKMLTAAAALYHLGPMYRYQTTLSKMNDDFYITFSGSPSLTSDDLTKLVANLPKQIAGNIIMDTTRFKPPYYAAGMSYDDLGWYYDAPSTAVILNENMVSYDFISAAAIGSLIQIKPLAPENGLTLINEVVTVTKEQEQNHCSFNIEIKANNTLHLYGCLAKDEKPKQMKLAITDPELYAKQIITKSVNTNQINLQGNILNGATPEQSTVISTYQSDELVKLVAHMLEESDNLYADSITKSLGYALTNQGTYKQGAFAIKKILSQHTTMNMKLVEIADGQGTRYNLTTPEQIGVLLSNIYSDETIKPLFIASLPKMGLSGTLKDRMKQTPLANKVFAKTGTMHDISALSGYMTTASGKPLIFSIVSNGVHGNVSSAKQLEEKIVQLLYTQVK